MLLPAGEDGSPLARLAAWTRQADIRNLIGCVAGRIGLVVSFLQAVAVNPGDRGADPQANVHADTFHANAKYWLFLRDVGSDEGPLAYVPGSHVPTPGRLDWEHAQASRVASNPDGHHAMGSFRITDVGYGQLRTFPVRANTLVVADTFGFHRRAQSVKPGVRTALFGRLRNNPFLPWNGPDPLDLPILSRRTMAIHLKTQERLAPRGCTDTYAREGTLLAAEWPAEFARPRPVA